MQTIMWYFRSPCSSPPSPPQAPRPPRQRSGAACPTGKLENVIKHHCNFSKVHSFQNIRRRKDPYQRVAARGPGRNGGGNGGRNAFTLTRTRTGSGAARAGLATIGK